MKTTWQILIWVLIVTSVFGTTMCRSNSGSDGDPSATPTTGLSETEATDETAAVNESGEDAGNTEPEVADATVQPTRTARPTRTIRPTTTQTLPPLIAEVEERDSSEQASEQTNSAESTDTDNTTEADDVTPTRLPLVIRTQRPTDTPLPTPTRTGSNSDSSSSSSPSSSSPSASETPESSSSADGSNANEPRNVLLVPTRRTYTVQYGDTFGSIAIVCEVSVPDLLDANSMEVEDADHIVVGQVLIVPDLR